MRYTRIKKILLVQAGLLVGLLVPFLYAHEGSDVQLLRLNAALDRCPGDHQLYFLRGELFREHAQVEVAEKDYFECLKLNPECDDVYLGLGKLYHAAGRYAAAVSNLNTFVECRPLKPDGYAARAPALMALQDFSGALMDFNQAIHLTSLPDPDLYLGRADVLLALHPEDPGPALQSLSQAAESTGSLVVLEQRALSLEIGGGMKDRARARLKRLCARTPLAWLETEAKFLEGEGALRDAALSYERLLTAMQRIPPYRLRSSKYTALRSLAESELRRLRKEVSP